MRLRGVASLDRAAVELLGGDLWRRLSFNVFGLPDILWQNSDGQASIFQVEGNAALSAGS
jgi:hypothetical protein